MRSLLRKRIRPTAVICMNDRLAFGAYQALAEAGLGIPQDMSVVSFDDDVIAAWLRPGLSTAALPHEQMGAEPSSYCSPDQSQTAVWCRCRCAAAAPSDHHRGLMLGPSAAWSAMALNRFSW